MKIIINDCFGGFGISPLCQKKYLESIGKTAYFYEEKNFNGEVLTKADTSNMNKLNSNYYVVCTDKDFGDKVSYKEFYNVDRCHNIYVNFSKYRTDERLIKIVEELGILANGRFSNLKVVEIPDDVIYEIDDYDGIETVREVSRSWR